MKAILYEALNFIAFVFTFAVCVVFFYRVLLPPLVRWLFKSLKLVPVLLVPLASFGGEAVLNIERRGGDVILYITGGTSNVQYQVWTPANNNLAQSDQWYYWRRIYSRDFLSNPGYGEVLVYGENTSKQLRRFFQIRGVLPD